IAQTSKLLNLRAKLDYWLVLTKIHSCRVELRTAIAPLMKTPKMKTVTFNDYFLTDSAISPRQAHFIILRIALSLPL
ncbi:MAG: hypothetical protein KAS94_13335, partial [Desulfobulbaceae bacterium]|nr:hypothetical protein [Desulfobulbaceae bacterium]